MNKNFKIKDKYSFINEYEGKFGDNEVYDWVNFEVHGRYLDLRF